MSVPTLGASGLAVTRLCLGASVFGWTVDRDGAFAVLDAYTAAGGTFLDTADAYMWHVPGNCGGESETIIGEWLARRGRRDDVVIATKVGSLPRRPGLSAATITAACDESLRRLRTDRIDVYYAHRDDPATPQAETAAAFDALVRAGKVRAVAASNFSPDRLRSALAVARAGGWSPYVALQPQYNLVERAEYEATLAPLLAAEGLACVPYYGLARGFLTGKYRGHPGELRGPRADGVRRYLTDHGWRVLAALDEVAAAHRAPVAAVALAWVAAQPTVAAPIASARTPDQLAALLPALHLTLTGDELALLTEASAVTPR